MIEVSTILLDDITSGNIENFIANMDILLENLVLSIKYFLFKFFFFDGVSKLIPFKDLGQFRIVDDTITLIGKDNLWWMKLQIKDLMINLRLQL